MEVDFGKHTTASGLKLYMFCALLSASRYKYAAFKSEPFTTLELIHHLLDSFNYMGEIPEDLLIDRASCKSL